MRLIDADALHAGMVESYMILHKLYEDAQDEQTIKNIAGQLVAFAELMMRVKDAPTIDAEPVRHGVWEWYEEPYDSRNPDGDYGWRCSCCKQDLENELVLGVPGISHVCAMLDNPDDPPTIMRCPHCGAKMDAKEDE